MSNRVPTEVLFINSATGPWGAEQSMVTLAHGLERLGVKCRLFCLSSSVATLWQTVAVGEVVVVPEFGAPNRMMSNWAFFRRATDIRRDSAVLVFSYELLPAVAPIRLFLRLLANRSAFVWDCHDVLSGPLSRIGLATCLRFVDSTVSVSKFAADANHVKRAKVLTRPVLRDTRVAVPDTNNLPSNSLCRIGIVGRVDPAKNVGLVVRAVAGLDCETVLVVRGGVGVGSKEVTDSILLDGYKLLGDRFRYQGEVSRSDSMKDLDILVVANSFEPMGRTVLEAQLAGVLVVVPDSGGASELVLEAQTGYHFASDDVSSLIGVLRRIISGSDDLDAIRSSAKSRTERLTDPETYATQYMMAIGVM